MLRFSCEKALLQSAVNTTSRAVAAKSSIPALEGILLEGGDTLTLSGYNMQTGIRTKVAADVTEGGSLVLSARLFGDMIRRLPDDVVVFASDKNYECKADLRRRFLRSFRHFCRRLPRIARGGGPIFLPDPAKSAAGP